MRAFPARMDSIGRQYRVRKMKPERGDGTRSKASRALTLERRGQRTLKTTDTTEGSSR